MAYDDDEDEIEPVEPDERRALLAKMEQGSNNSAPSRPQVAPVSLPSAPPVSAQPSPTMPAVNSMPPVARPTPMESGQARIAQLGARPDPNAPQYQPVAPTMGRKILQSIAAGMVGYKNVDAGLRLGQQLDQAPIRTAQQKFATDQGNYNQAFGQAQAENAAEENAPLREAETAHTEAETDVLKNPAAKLENAQQGYAGAISDALNRGTDPGTDPHVQAWKQAIDDVAKEASPKEGETPLGDTATNLNKALQNRYQVLNPGKTLPPEYSVTPKSTQKDYDRIEKSLTGEEGATGTKVQRDLAQSDREQARTDKAEKAGKPTADEQRRSDLAENLNENLDSLEDIVKRRPELFGPLSGRWAELKQKFGNDDPDLGKLQTIEHQIGMAQISAHGMRSAQGVQSAADSIMNNLHNGPHSILSSIGAVRDSVKTFAGDVDRAKQPAGAPAKGGKSAPSGGKVIQYDAQGNRVGG